MSSSQRKSDLDIIEERSSKGENTVVRRYSKGKFLGKGGFAKVYELTNLETKQIYASKIIPKASLTKNRAKQKLLTEIKIHKGLKHPNVVRFEHVFEDSENVYILLELAQNQTMNELIKRRKRLTEIEAACYMIQIINSLKFLHKNKIIHRDIKLGNLFLGEKMDIKVGDFGLATKVEFEGERKRTVCGTPNYIAPEILENKNGHSYEADIWSLGVIFYTVLIGKPPFETNDVKATYKRIRMNTYSFPDHVPISHTSKQLIQLILQTEPSRRPSFDQILQHDFFMNQGEIPDVMPISTLACPPAATFLRQFQRSNSQILVKKYEKISLQSNSNLQQPFQLLQEKKDFNNLPISSQRDRIASTNLQNANEYQITNQDYKKQYLDDKLIGPDVWVIRWVDYSAKYGLGYLLSNGYAGVCFNDATKIICTPDQKQFEYCERSNADKTDIITKHSMLDFPKDLQKKVTLLNHFTNYLMDEQQSSQQQQNTLQKQNSIHPTIFVKKWLKTKHACIFRLSNKVVQVIFSDLTEILLSSELRLVTYVNKKHQRLNFPLANALESQNQEMTKRLKYTKDILTQMLGGTSNQQLQNNILNDQQEIRCQTQQINHRQEVLNQYAHSKSPQRIMQQGFNSNMQLNSNSNTKFPQQISNTQIKKQETLNSNQDFQATFVKSQTLSRIGQIPQSKQQII